MGKLSRAGFDPIKFVGFKPTKKNDSVKAKEGAKAETLHTLNDGYVETNPLDSNLLLPKNLGQDNSTKLKRTSILTGLTATAKGVPALASIGIDAAKDVVTGATRESHFEHSVQKGSEEEAKATFDSAKEKLLNPNEWKKLGPKWGAANFKVYCGKTNKPMDGPPKQGDKLKIQLPDKLPSVWVNIDKIETTENSAKVVVRPTANPTSKSESVAHFFSDQTLNVFQVNRDGDTVTSSVTGVNEQVNTKGNTFEKALAGLRLTGAWMGAKKPQWNSFTKKLLAENHPQSGKLGQGLEAATQAASQALSAGKGS